MNGEKENFDDKIERIDQTIKEVSSSAENEFSVIKSQDTKL